MGHPGGLVGARDDVRLAIVRFLGIDYGERRIGLALSDVSGTLATPWRTVVVSGSAEQRLTSLLELVRELQASDDGLAAIVIGLPRRLDGSATEQTGRVSELAETLRTRTELRVELQDERLTSREAESRLALRDRDWRSRKAKLDAAAAAIVLQDYLDSQVNRPSGK